MLAPRSGFLWHRILLCGQLQLVRADLDQLIRTCPPLLNHADLQDFEERVQSLTQRLHALLAATAVCDALDSPQLNAATRRLIDAFPKQLKNQGLRHISLHFAQGPAVGVFLPYYSRAKASSGRKSKGCFPTLILLGIYDHCSPSLASVLTHLVALLGSFAEARTLLQQRGVSLCVNTLRAISYHYAERVRVAQKHAQTLAGSSLAGRVVVITTDGGRLRIRRDRKAKTKKRLIRRMRVFVLKKRTGFPLFVLKK
jgi:hypothetical protein